MHTFSPSTQAAKRGEPLWVQGQPDIQSSRTARATIKRPYLNRQTSLCVYVPLLWQSACERYQLIRRKHLVWFSFSLRSPGPVTLGLWEAEHSKEDMVEEDVHVKMVRRKQKKGPGSQAPLLQGHDTSELNFCSLGSLFYHLCKTFPHQVRINCTIQKIQETIKLPKLESIME